MNKPEHTNKSRRDFLRTGIAASAGAAAVAAVPVAVAAPEAPVKEEKVDKGYHETPHIKDYYRTAKF